MIKALWVIVWAIIGYGVGFLAGMVVGMALGYWRADKEIREDDLLAELDDRTAWDMGPWND